MKRKLVRSLCWVAMTCCVLPAAADTMYSNLGTGNNVYNCCTGWTIFGTGFLGTSFTAANEFQVNFSSYVFEIDVAVGYVAGDNLFYLNIDADNAGQPGAVLASFTNLSSSTDFGSCCGLVTVYTGAGPNLSAGTNYWLVIGPMDTTSTTWEAWNFSNSAVGLDEYSTDGGLTWVNNGIQGQGAFQILGGGCCGTTPEPASLLLFGSGLAGAVAAGYRKTRR